MTQKNNLLRNASFLMIAALISKVIGLLYKSPLSEIVGRNWDWLLWACTECVSDFADDRIFQHSSGSIESDCGTAGI